MRRWFGACRGGGEGPDTASAVSASAARAAEDCSLAVVRSAVRIRASCRAAMGRDDGYRWDIYAEGFHCGLLARRVGRSGGREQEENSAS